MTRMRESTEQIGRHVFDVITMLDYVHAIDYVPAAIPEVSDVHDLNIELP